MNLTTSYLGLQLPHPFIAGASPLGSSVDGVKRLEDGGAAAIVLPSLFEEQITLATDGRIHHMDPEEPQFAERLAVFPPPGDYPLGPEDYLTHLARVKAAVAIPVIASLNGSTPESWLKFASAIEGAGADALELNLYEVVTDLAISGAAIEHEYCRIVGDLKRLLRIPVAVKISPFFAACGNVARSLDAAGADALVLFNRFYQPDIDVATATAIPRLELSTSQELPLRLRWLAILYGRVRPALAVTGGVATPDDGIKAILAGADAVQMVSAILRHGPSHFSAMRAGLEQWMQAAHVSSVDEVRGRASLQRVAEPAAFERANYIRMLQSWPS